MKQHTYKIRLFLILILTFSLSVWVNAEDEIELFVSHYKDSGDLNVFSPNVRINKTVDEDSNVAFKYGFENFSKQAKSTSNADDIDALSGATTISGGSGGGFDQNRHEAVLSGNSRYGDLLLGGSLYASEETDFSSRGFSVNYAEEFLQKNLTLSANYSYTYDQIDVDSLTVKGVQDKKSQFIAFGLTQLLSPVSLINAGYSFGYVKGYQSNPLRKIIVEAPFALETYDEFHPDKRLRHTLFFGGSYYWLNRMSLNSDISLYTDDWGLKSSSAQFLLNKYLFSKWIIQGRLRFYNQSESDFYQELYTQRQNIMTADTRLRPFKSILLGVKLTYRPPIFVRGWRLSIAYNRYQETNNGLSANIFKLSTVFPY